VYEKGVTYNPKSIELWNCFCSWTYSAYAANYPDVVTNIYERALKEISYDTNAFVIWDTILNFEKTRSPVNTDKLYWKIMNYPTKKPDTYIQGYSDFIGKASQEDYTSIMNDHQDLLLLPDSLNNRAYLINAFEMKYKANLASYAPLADATKLDELLGNEKTQYEGAQTNEKKNDQIREFFSREEVINKRDQVIFFYERGMNVMCRYPDYWISYFNYLDRDENTAPKIQELYPKYEKHFASIDHGQNIFVFLADLKEKQKNLEGTREIYEKLISKLPNYDAFLNYIYFEAREKDAEKLLVVVQKLIDAVAHNPEALAFAISEITDIAVKVDVTKQIHELLIKGSDIVAYDRTFYLAWINFLRFAKFPWEDLYSVFLKALSTTKVAIEQEELWKVLIYTSRAYCDITTIKDVETKYLKRNEGKPTDNIPPPDAAAAKKKRKWDFSGTSITEEASSHEQIKKQLKT
jgi:small nuclear ribonucleoprotein (snRNP)-like protein